MSSTSTNKVFRYAAVKCRGRQRKTQSTYTEEDVKFACDMVMKDGISIRQVAKKRNIPHKTLDR